MSFFTTLDTKLTTNDQNAHFSKLYFIFYHNASSDTVPMAPNTVPPSHTAKTAVLT